MVMVRCLWLWLCIDKSHLRRLSPTTLVYNRDSCLKRYNHQSNEHMPPKKGKKGKKDGGGGGGSAGNSMKKDSFNLTIYQEEKWMKKKSAVLNIIN